MIVATCRKVAGSSSTSIQKFCGLLYPRERIYFQSSHLLDKKRKLKDRSTKSQNLLFLQLRVREGIHISLQRNQSMTRSIPKASSQKVLPDATNIPVFSPGKSGVI